MSDTPFGLRNKNGSCWINAALQAIFRIPDLQERFNEDEQDDKNPIEACLSEMWGSRGEEGLKDFYECVKTTHMPAGEGIGDSHELIELLCDKVPFLDKLFRFRIANKVTCTSCSASDMRMDTMIEFSVAPTQKKQSAKGAITESVSPHVIPDWTCEKCKGKGCTKELLLREFPTILMFHQTSIGTSMEYTPILRVNGINYALFAVVCFTGGHWFTLGRDLPPGKPWYRLDDGNVTSYAPNFMPLADNMRLILYYRLKE